MYGGSGTHPDVYVTEAAAPQATGAPSSQKAAVPAYVAIAQKGVVGKASAVQSFADYQNQFGTFINSSYGAYVLKAQFDKGGDSLTYFTRTVHYLSAAAIPVGSSVVASVGGGTANSPTQINASLPGATAAIPVGTVIRVRGQIAVVQSASTTSPYSPTTQLLTLYSPLILGAPTVGMSITDGNVTDYRQSAPSQTFVSDQGGISQASPQYAFQYESLGDGTYYNNIQLKFTAHPVLTTTIAAPAIAGNTTITLSSVTGLKVGQQLLIGVAGQGSTHGEYKSIIAKPNGLVVSLDSPLVNSYAQNVVVTEQSYDITVYSSGKQVEYWPQLSSGSNSKKYQVAALNSTLGGSQYVNVTDLGSTNYDGNVPVPGIYTLQSGLDGINNPVTGSSMMVDADFIGNQSLGTGLYSFDSVTDYVLNPSVPGVTSNAVYAALVAYSVNRTDCFSILDSPAGSLPTDMQNLINTSPAILFSYAGLYYPWIVVADPIGSGYNPTKLIPPCGYVNGAYISSDKVRGFFKAPAGVQTQLTTALGVEYRVSNNDQNLLNPIGVNCIRQFPSAGIIVDGAKTLSCAVGDNTYDTVPVRRMFLQIEKELQIGARSFIFEPNNANLLNSLYQFTNQILLNHFLQGWFLGSTATQAYSIVADSSNNGLTQQAQDSAQVSVGIAAVRPAEFIYFTVGYNTSTGTLTVNSGS